VPRVLNAAEVIALQQATAAITVDPEVVDYAVRIVAATRHFPGIALGAGPRGSIALVRAARAQAVLAGRDFVTPVELHDLLSAAGLSMGNPTGIAWSPNKGLHLSDDLSLNYIVTVTRG